MTTGRIPPKAPVAEASAHVEDAVNSRLVPPAASNKGTCCRSQRSC